MRDLPAAPDGSDRGIGRVRRPEAPPVRGPAAGVPEIADVSLSDLLAHGPAGSAGDEVPDGPLPSEQQRFQHTSELRFARLLDFFGIVWEYEPDEFPIEWGEDGAPTAWFRPDFYLPTFDTYIEITTSAQRLVTRKNRKIRLLREHYPQVRCKLFYQRDYLALVRRFGLDADLDEDE